MEEQLTREQSEIVEKNVGLVIFCIKRFFKYPVCDLEYDDMLSIGMGALCQASVLYNSEKGAFSSYAIATIKNAILSYIKNYDIHFSKDISLFLPAKTKQDDENTLIIDRIEDKNAFKQEDVLGDITDIEDFEQLLDICFNILTRKQIIVYLYLISGYSTAKISNEIGLTHQAIWNILKKNSPLIKKCYLKKMQYKRKWNISVNVDSINLEFSFLKGEKNNKDFIEIIRNLSDFSKMKEFDILFYNGSIIIKIPRYSKYPLLLIAIILELDKFCLSNNYIENIISLEDTESLEYRKIKEYLLTLNKFSYPELKEKFPKSDIYNVISNMIEEKCLKSEGIYYFIP